ncbi:NTP/NDP exchange transporter [Leeuwenhoekiella palythoae]|uniref:ADP,ATP carrier protein n=1 Tax=Leeuwenhoekiella palythoae TaxID=573501 RepID=A0A1M5SKT5_9FLAO|nr:Npt1/Npt2 family nucleotide transporter [Leeuwenhoekiella palythoae]RXG28935.1 AAA family ATP:ADP antiporter [Leeuwenhoekiella palythoae]SHH39154.1 ATP:ADP antiporter, AAA family [Leeuwenhoekiella palythoae]
MQLYVFLIITILLIVKPTVNALFLKGLGADSLAFGYLLIAATAIVTSYFYNQAVRRYSLRRIMVSSLVFFALAFVFLAVLYKLNAIGAIALYIFYVISGIFAVLTTSQFWLLANMVFNAREAKRLFGFIGSGAIAGGIFGGYLTTILVPYIGNGNMLLIAALFIISCIPLLSLIYKKGYVSRASISESSNHSLGDSAYKLLLKSRHLTYLALIIGLGVIVAKLVDFQFSDFAARSIPDADQLASFFGFWFSTFNLVSLGIQLFLTNRVVEKLGVNSSLLILPLGIALGSLLFLTFPELWVLIIIKGIDGSFKQSVNKAATELAMVPVSLEIKNRTKSFIDVVVDSVATGIAGCLLIFVIKGLSLPSNYVTVIIIFLILVWIVGIFRVRDSYFKSFRQSLKEAVEVTEGVPRRKRKSPLELGKRILSNGNPLQIVEYLNHLNKRNAKILKQKIIPLLNHVDDAVKIAAINQLYHYPEGTALEAVRDMVHLKDDEVVYAAMNYLILHTSLNDSRIFDSYLNHSSDYIAHAALLCLAKEARNNQQIASRYNLELRIELWLAELELPDSDHRPEELSFLLESIGYAQMPQFYSFISANFNNRNPHIVSHAIIAAGISRAPQFIDALIDFLTVKQYRKDAIAALIAYGESISEILLAREAEKLLKNNAKKYIPAVIQTFETQASVRVLLRLLQSRDNLIRRASAKSLHKLKGKNPKLNYFPKTVFRLLLQYTFEYRDIVSSRKVIKSNFNAKAYDRLPEDDQTELLQAREGLLEVLDRQLSLRIETIFQLLAVYYSRKDLDVAYKGFVSTDRDTRANAIEFLDNILSPKLKHSLLPLLELAIIEDVDVYQEILEDDISFNKALIKLIEVGDGNLRLPVIYLIQFLGDTSFLPLLAELKITAKNRDVRSFASLALKKLQPALLDTTTGTSLGS